MRLIAKVMGPIALTALAAVAAPQSTGGYMPDGYWANRNNGGGVDDTYLRITSDSGYYCFLDGKSSFRFKVAADSINTPMNGNNAIHWYADSGDIQIDGEEKGVNYSDRFKSITSAAYPKYCVDEEARLYPSALRRAGPGSPRSGSVLGQTRVDALGRSGATGTRVISPSPLYPTAARSGTHRDPSL